MGADETENMGRNRHQASEVADDSGEAPAETAKKVRVPLSKRAAVTAILRVLDRVDGGPERRTEVMAAVDATISRMAARRSPARPTTTQIDHALSQRQVLALAMLADVSTYVARLALIEGSGSFAGDTGHRIAIAMAAMDGAYR